MTLGRSTVCIVDYEAGNLTSVRLALDKLGWDTVMSGKPEKVLGADRVIFPGVGAAPSAMENLQETGLSSALLEYARSGRPMLGICLGAQIIFEHSAEGYTTCLGLLPGTVEPLNPGPDFKVPHMGWNTVDTVRGHPVWTDVEDGSQFYFVHGYAVDPAEEDVVIGRTDYDGLFVSAVARDNVLAFQFHPERSGRFGLQVLDNFLRWSP
ncbi:MAG: imidazole glycerol phosphate synthase subunit HisH [Planctomycetota bacterium]